MELTTKLSLKKPGLADYVKVSDLNDNMDILDEAVGELKQGSTIMEDLQTVDKTLSGAINEALEKANQAFQSASDGKQVIATAITGKGVPTSSSDTFQKMATNIDAIETDISIGTTNAVAGDILLGKKAISQGNLITGTIPSKGAATITPTTSPQTIPAGQYLSGAQTIAGVSVPVANVLAGVTIAGAVGTMPNRGALNQIITSNNGQVNISAGYYTGGVIKAIFTNLIASNIMAGVNIGGVVGNLVPAKTITGAGVSQSTDSTFRFYMSYYSGYTNTTRPAYKVDYNFGFIPSTIIIISSVYAENVIYCRDANFSYGLPEKTVCIVNKNSSGGDLTAYTVGGSLSVTATGFTLPSNGAYGKAFTWFAIA